MGKKVIYAVVLIGALILVFLLPGSIREMLFNRGWTPYAMMACTGIILATLGAKFFELGKNYTQLRTLKKFIDSIEDKQIANKKDLNEHNSSFKGKGWENFFIGKRLLEVLEHLSIYPNVKSAQEFLDRREEVDLDRVSASYVLPKVLIWSIPILGFLGTVMGVSQAVGGFSDFLQVAREIEEIKGALGNVTVGLSVAFETTLLALFISVCVMFLSTYIEKEEISFYTDLKVYLNQFYLERCFGAYFHREGLEGGEERAREDSISVLLELQESLGENIEACQGIIGKNAAECQKLWEDSVRKAEEWNAKFEESLQPLLRVSGLLEKVLENPILKNLEGFGDRLFQNMKELQEFWQQNLSLTEQSREYIEQYREILAQSVSALQEAGKGNENLQKTLEQLRQHQGFLDEIQDNYEKMRREVRAFKDEKDEITGRLEQFREKLSTAQDEMQRLAGIVEENNRTELVITRVQKSTE